MSSPRFMRVAGDLAEHLVVIERVHRVGGEQLPADYLINADRITGIGRDHLDDTIAVVTAHTTDGSILYTFTNHQAAERWLNHLTR